MTNFYCPIHNTSEYNIVHIDCHVDSWDDYYCSECLNQKLIIQEIEKWFNYKCTSKVSTLLKKRLKQSFVDVYRKSDDGLERYSRIGYLTIKDRPYIFHAYIYSYGLLYFIKKEKPKYRLFIQILNKSKTIDIEADALPYHLFNDNEFLLEVLK